MKEAEAAAGSFVICVAPKAMRFKLQLAGAL
jgi:hypothetical protein